MTTESDGEGASPDAGDAEDTILGPAMIGIEPPPLVEPGEAEADTIIVTRANSGRRRATGPVLEPATDLEPARFALRIGTHPPIPLEVPAYIGRRPSTPRITGNRMPRLVMVPSPLREVSSTHVEVRQEGTAVVVTDLGSTNGTIVTNEGFPPRGLRQGESIVVGPGSMVDIGDGIRVVVVEMSADIPAEGAQ